MRACRLPLAALALFPGLLAAAPAGTEGEGPQVQVTVDRPRPAADDSVRVTFTFSGPGAGGDVRAPAPLPLKNLSILGGPSTSTQIVFMNGDLRRSVAYTYYLRPQGTGTAEVGETTWTVGGRTVLAPSYVLEVGPARGRGPGGPPPGEEEPEDDPFARMFGSRPRPPVPVSVQSPRRRDAILEYVATPDRTSAYVGEEITIHYELVTQLDVRGLEFLEPPKFPGLWAEDLEKPEKPQGRRDLWEGQPVTRFTLLKKAVSGLSPGPVTVPAAKIRLAVRPVGDPFFDPFGTQKQIVERSTKPIPLTIIPIPGNTAFKGPVGKFELTAKVDRSRVAAGEAVTLRVRLSGTGNLRTATEPPRIEIPNARLYPPTTKPDGARAAGRAGVATEWDYVLVPSAPGPLVIPPVTLEVFDPSEKKVVAKTTAAITLLVEGSAATAPAVVSARESAPAGSASGTQSAATEEAPALRAASSSPAPPVARPTPATLDLTKGTVTIPLWVLAALPGALAVVGGTVLYARHRRRAGAALNGALAPEADETKERAAARIDRALRELFAGKYGVPDGTPPAALLDALAIRDAPEEVQRELKTLLEELDFLRFAPQLGDYSAKIAEARERAARLLRRL